MGEPRGRAVQADHAAPARTPDRVGVESLAVHHVEHLHLLMNQNVGRVQEVGVDRDRPFVIQIGLGDTSPMDL